MKATSPIFANVVSPGLGRVFEATVWRARACPQYLARYTHRVAISNHRILSVTESEVQFRWKDYANHDKKRTMTLTGEEFLRRFLQHVLPKGFPRIRYFGWLANRKRGPLLQLCRLLLAQIRNRQKRPNSAMHRSNIDANTHFGRTSTLSVPRPTNSTIQSP